jgi:hypothetical protein
VSTKRFLVCAFCVLDYLCCSGVMLPSEPCFILR